MNFFIDFSNEKVKDLQLFVYNSIGQLVYTKLYKGQSPSLIEIPSLNFDQGTYRVSLSSLNGKTWSSLLVKL